MVLSSGFLSVVNLTVCLVSAEGMQMVLEIFGERLDFFNCFLRQSVVVAKTLSVIVYLSRDSPNISTESGVTWKTIVVCCQVHETNSP